MKTEVSYAGRGDSSTTINKRGCQVIANYLGVDVQTDAIESAPETGSSTRTTRLLPSIPMGGPPLRMALLGRTASTKTMTPGGRLRCRPKRGRISGR